MADPGTMALILGIGFMAVGQIRQGQVAKAQGKFAEKVAQANNMALQRQAEAEKEAARIDEERESRKGKIFMALQRATAGKSNIGLAGATLNVLADTAFQFSLNRNLILRRGLLRSRELRQRGAIELAQGSFAKSVGKQAYRTSILSAAGTVAMGVYQSGAFAKAPTGSGITSSTTGQFSSSYYTTPQPL